MFFGGQGAISGTPRGSYGGQNSKMLNFEPIRHMRGLFASFSGAELNGNVKILIFGLLGGSGGHSGTPGGSYGGSKFKNAQF